VRLLLGRPAAVTARLFACRWEPVVADEGRVDEAMREIVAHCHKKKLAGEIPLLCSLPRDLTVPACRYRERRENRRQCRYCDRRYRKLKPGVRIRTTRKTIKITFEQKKENYEIE